MQFNDKTRFIFDKVKEIINPVYLVGGSVRDALLGKESSDWDFCTPLTPEETEKAMKKAGKKVYNIGGKFGTLAMKIEGEQIEITTFRTEKYHFDSRKPSVCFVNDLTADLSRRDFTINAIAWDGENIIDSTSGQFDLMNKNIKCVDNPKDRFKEDPLRMLRAGRFASQLEFEIDQHLEGTAKNMGFKIFTVSKERWVQEFDKMLMADKPSIGLDFLARTRLLNYMIPELALQVGYKQNSPYHKLKLWDHTLLVVDNVAKDIGIRWAALLHDIGKPYVRTNKSDRSNYIHHELVGADLAERIGLYLHWSSDRIKYVKNLIYNHMQDNSPLREADYLGKNYKGKE